MAELAAIRAALAAALAGLPDIQKSAYLLSNPTPPVVMVGGVNETDWRTEFGGGPTWSIPIVLYTGTTADLAAQKKLDLYLGTAAPYSARAALEADRTLGGVVSSVVVTGTTGYRTYVMETNALYLGAEITVEIFD